MFSVSVSHLFGGSSAVVIGRESLGGICAEQIVIKENKITNEETATRDGDTSKPIWMEKIFYFSSLDRRRTSVNNL